MALVGANAAGKTTTIRVVSGLVAPRHGRVLFDGGDLATIPAHRRPELGIVQVPEGRRLFPFMTVAENLLLGAHPPRARDGRQASLDYVYSLFPTLASGAPSSPARSRAASSRCARSAAPSWPDPSS